MSAQARKVAQALKDYGAYVVDETGGDYYAFSVDAAALDEWHGGAVPAGGTSDPATMADLQVLYPALQIIDNSGPLAVGGGGETRRAPWAPPFTDACVTAEPTPTPTPTPTSPTPTSTTPTPTPTSTTPTPSPTGTPTTVEKRITVSTDDAEEYVSNYQVGTVITTSADIELTYDGSVGQKIGLRFPGLTIPQGATVTNAYVTFTARDAGSAADVVTFKAQAADNAPTFAAASNNVTSRVSGAASATWTPGPWTVGGTFTTPDLGPVVQEVVNRAGWVSGNAVALLVTGTGTRNSWAVDGQAASAALLHVEYQ